MNSKILKVKNHGGNLIPVKIKHFDDELKFSVTISTKKKSCYKFTNNMEEYHSEDFHIWDIVTIENKDKTFETVFYMKYNCGAYNTISIEINSDKLFTPSAFVNFGDWTEEYTEENGEYFVKFNRFKKACELNYFKKDFKIINGPKQ